MIGLNLSHCVKDIAEGKTALGDVTLIVARTDIPGPITLEKVIADYRQGIWRKNADQCERIARELFATGKITQPRILAGDNNCVPDIHTQGTIVWVKHQSEITWVEAPPRALIETPLLSWEKTVIN